jgi:hypothetical protein
MDKGEVQAIPELQALDRKVPKGHNPQALMG